MRVSLQFAAVYAVMVQQIYAYAGIAMQDVALIKDHPHMKDLALLIIEKGQVTLLYF